MRNKRATFLALAVTIGCGIAAALLVGWPIAPKVPQRSAKTEITAKSAELRTSSQPSGVPELPPVQAGSAAKREPPARLAETAVAPKATSQKPPQQASPAPKQGDPPPEDELARVALSFVGADPEAETYWVEAINDPSLSGDERSNLIEDLNEDGLSDPKHPSPTDLPLILNRIALIEQLAGDAMDKINLDAFEEAHKDLVNLAKLATGGGEPVK